MSIKLDGKSVTFSSITKADFERLERLLHERETRLAQRVDDLDALRNERATIASQRNEYERQLRETREHLARSEANFTRSAAEAALANDRLRIAEELARAKVTAEVYERVVDQLLARVALAQQ